MKTISQRQLRNDNAEVIRGVEAGESFTVTRRGVPVARLIPLRDQPDLRCDRPARTQPAYSSRPRISIRATTSDVLDELRGDR